jgi:hypothetical protein
VVTRKQDWQLAFEKCVAENYHTPFEWGTHDCCLWAANLVLAITGHDVAVDFRGKYSTAKEALEILEAGGGVAALWTKHLGAEPVPPLFASVGDVVLADLNGQETMAVCNGDTLLATGTTGLCALPMSAAIKSWRV